MRRITGMQYLRGDLISKISTIRIMVTRSDSIYPMLIVIITGAIIV